ncbi:MAG: DUF6044 family protein [Planctomycetota bacterium]
MKPMVFLLLVGTVAIGLYLGPYVVLGQDAHVLIHDHLDLQPTQHWRHLHKENLLWRSGEPDASFLKGTMPAYQGPDVRGEWWSYYLLRPFPAFLVNQFVSRMIALLGMYLLLCGLLSRGRFTRAIAGGTAILFALLNHYPPCPSTIAALPWLAYGLLRIHRRSDRWWHWAIVCLCPFISFFFFGPFFLLAVVCAFWLVNGLRRRQWQWRVLGAVFLVGCVSILASYDLVLDAVSKSYTSQRSAWQPAAHTASGLSEAIDRSVRTFIEGHYHVRSHHKLILLLTVVTMAAAGALWIARRLSRRSNQGADASSPTGLLASPVLMLVLLLVMSGLFSVILGFWKWTPFASWYLTLPVLKMLNLSRFHWLHPLLWSMTLAYALTFWAQRTWLQRHAAIAWALLLVVFTGQAAQQVRGSDFVGEQRAGRPTYRQFFAERQFAAIRDFIGRHPESYHVASVGLHPSIALYNGFYCLDGYQSNHSLDYHLQFRDIIAPELDRNERNRNKQIAAGDRKIGFDLKGYFDSWGGRCYVFSSELTGGSRYLCTKDLDEEIERLVINRSAFREMGGRYLLSAVRIRKAEECGLSLLEVFEDDDRYAAWRIHLYEVLP